MSEKNGRAVLDEVLGRFPTSGPTIRTLFREVNEFRELCVDYAECTAVLDRLRRGQGAADARIEQYRELRMNLEQELQNRISGSVLRMSSLEKGEHREEETSP